MFVGECLELGVEGFLVKVVSHEAKGCHESNTYSGKADFVTRVVEATDAILGVFVVVVLDEAEAMEASA